ncbi:beta-ketoacyl-[acyl-carrier-protein] synthase family protein [Geopsychrobacter electrodiphilus]|uniref:beta-ketoacyl-[acyl-carrier-protein] synthase family protein n=1 Tax=Geopsychrobacter electrodiphilus TaxID=225196 RepID=UPI0003789D96|nr:beta-ketoacyl-[acyl-carrier-protein] synthase family protein [Geopsychrobacter electrodiphilus]
MALESVVVTGIGIISPLGHTFDALMAALYVGESGVKIVPELDHIGGLRSRLAARVEGVEPKNIPRKIRRSMSNMSVYAYLASQQALAMAAYPEALLASGRTGVMIGSTLGSTETSEAFFADYFRDHSLERMKSGLFFQIMGHSCAANVAQSLGITGRVMAPSAACATSCQALGYAYEQIAFGRQDAILCGGADEFHPLTVATFDVMHAASTAYNQQPDAAPRPFDRARDGLVCGEGSGILLLEKRSVAAARGARVLAEIIGFATTSDTSSIANPDAGAMYDCMRLALEDAGLASSDLDYINAHATGTLQGDVAEAEAIRRLVADRVPVSSLKGHLGHTMAASGSIELAACIGMMRQGELIRTRNLDEVDEQCCGLWHLQQNQQTTPKIVLKNNFAMGGINCTLIMRSSMYD